MGSSAEALHPTFAALLAHPAFSGAVQELAAVGVQISPAPVRGAKPYVLIGARSNARWWLLPLETGRLAHSGLALFQPVLPSARWFKTGASLLSLAHLQHLWARRKVYISTGQELACLTGRRDTAKFAFFTGTDSPHRKLAVQMMDSTGGIHAYAKVTRNSDVAALLADEAAVLRRLELLRLRSAITPSVLWANRIADATALVTDTLKTPSSRSPTELAPAHLEFVRELAHRTQGPKRTPQEVAAQFRNRLDVVAGRMNAKWRQRLANSVTRLASHPKIRLQTSLSHGDFTPWNTFVSERGLYVFDWEYATCDSMPGQDVAHFVLTASTSDSLRLGERYEIARQHVGRACPDLEPGMSDACVLAYLLSQCLRFIERAPVRADGVIDGWEREAEHASLLDYALSARCAA